MVMIYKILGIGMSLGGAYLANLLYTGVVGDSIKDTFLTNIYALVMLGGWGLSLMLILFGLGWALGSDPISVEKKRLEKEAEEKRLAEEQEEQRLSLLPKCDSCSAPLDSVTQTYTSELKETLNSEQIAKHYQYEFYNIYHDVTTIYTICCNNCNHCYDQEEIKKDVYITTKVECPKCENFDTEYSEVHSSNKDYFTVSCHCNNCQNDWRATQRENDLQKQYEEKLRREEERRIQAAKDEEIAKQRRIEEAERKEQERKTQSAKQWVGQEVRFIIMYKKGGSNTNLTERVMGVRGQAEARKAIEARYNSPDVQRISWVSDKAIYE